MNTIRPSHSLYIVLELSYFIIVVNLIMLFYELKLYHW